jgi:hypothetical protein
VAQHKRGYRRKDLRIAPIRDYLLLKKSFRSFIPNTTQLQTQVMRLVIATDHITSGLCKKPCIIKQNAPTDISIKADIEIPSVLRVRIVCMACGRKPKMSATLPA